MRVAVYARYSSESQRDESIDGQIRAIEEYCNRKGYKIVEKYIDRAKSATTDKRPEFLRMVEESKSGIFDVVCIHKLDRFSRDKYDSVTYKRKLKQNGVKVESVMEQLDDSPEAVILESVLEGMADYYSKNLARETMKGLKETALQCKHTGGTPPLGYDVDKETRKYIINEEEAKGVKLIFKLYLKGKTIPTIITELNEQGHRTKKGKNFGLNSIRSILKNEKYSGVYVFNKSASKDAYGKRNGSKVKGESEMIKVDGGVPSIISKEDYAKVQQMMVTRVKGSQGQFKAKSVYLLTGIVKCSCGYSAYGNRRKKKDKPLYVSYRCSNNHKKGSNACDNKELRKEYIEEFVLAALEKYLTKDNVSNNSNSIVEETKKEIGEKTKKLLEIEHKISNIVEAIMNGFSQAELKGKLDELNTSKERLSYEIQQLNERIANIEMEISEETIEEARNYIKIRDIAKCKEFIKKYVNKVEVSRDDIKVVLSTGKVVTSTREALYKKYGKHKKVA